MSPMDSHTVSIVPSLWERPCNQFQVLHARCRSILPPYQRSLILVFWWCSPFLCKLFKIELLPLDVLYFNWCIETLNFLLHWLPKHQTRPVRVSSWNHSHDAPSLVALCLLKVCAQHFILDALCTHDLPFMFLLNLASGNIPSKGTPIVSGLFFSFPLYYNNDPKLLINIISLPLIFGTI